MRQPVVVGSARTATGRFGGALSSVSATTLGGHAIRGALEAAGVDGSQVDYVTFGHVLQAGLGQITSRQAAVAAGVPMTVPSETMNKVCLSGLTAIARAGDLVASGQADVVIAGGMESMSNAPYVLDRARFGYRLGDGTLVDTMMHDGLTCAFDGCSMGLATERYQQGRSREHPTRAAQDELAVRSHERAAKATADGAFADEIVAVEAAGRHESVVVTRDEGIRDDTTLESLAKLRPAFDADGTITAGNASQISDGAAAVVVTARDVAEEHGLDVVASIDGWASVAGPDPSLLLQPAAAIRAVADRVSRDPRSFDLYEINEAFASVVLASTTDLELDSDLVNVHGGAIALGHPLGCSGARIVVTLLGALRRRGGGTGVAALCGGGGQGDALAVSVP